MGRDKFSQPDSPLYPPSNVTWQNSLLLINHDTRPVYDLHGYAFPDPVLFVSVQSAEKQCMYLQNWLKIRSTIIHKVSTLPWRDCFVSNQQWHTILTLFGKPLVDEEDI